MKSSALLAGLVGLIGGMGGDIDVERAFDAPTPRQPRPEGADARDMQAAEEKRARRAGRRLREEERRNGGVA